jgi:hypothetical protein
MRKTGIFLALIAFSIFLFLGFQVAKLFASPGEGQSGNLASEVETVQSNILIIHIDQIASDTPRLISMWVVFSYQADPVSLTFLPIYPTGKSGESDMAARFSLSEDKTISPGFLNQLQKDYNFQWDKIVLIDQEGVAYWSRIIQGSEFSQWMDENRLQPEINLVTNFCSAIRERGSDLLADLDWSQLIPDHMHTDLSFDQVMSGWDRIQNSGLCEVFTK